MAEFAVRSGDPTRDCRSLAAAYAETGRFEEAVRIARQIRADFPRDSRVPGNLDFQIRQYEARPYASCPDARCKPLARAAAQCSSCWVTIRIVSRAWLTPVSSTSELR